MSTVPKRREAARKAQEALSSAVEAMDAYYALEGRALNGEQEKMRWWTNKAAIEFSHIKHALTPMNRPAYDPHDSALGKRED